MKDINIFLIVVFVSMIISGVLLTLSYWGYRYKADIEKKSVYECGFSPFGQARTQFDIKFYLVSLLFIVFDVETLILCPFALEHISFSALEAFVVLVFCLLILFGICYEINSKVLDF